MTDADRQTLAAGMALGTLDAAEGAAAERLMRDDAAFAADVADWQVRLAPLAEALPPVMPPAALWRRIDNALGEADPVAEDRSNPLARQLEALRQSLAFWRFSAVSAAAAALLLGVLWIGDIGFSPKSPALADRYVALLNGDKGEDGFLVTVDASAGQLMIRSLGAKPPAAKTYELWLLKDDGTVPLTLGIIKPEPYVMVEMAKELRVDDWGSGMRLAVSVEGPDGAPSGRNMGPIVYAGPIIQQSP